MCPRKIEKMKKNMNAQKYKRLGGGGGVVDRRNTERSSVGMDVIQVQILRENLQNLIY